MRVLLFVVATTAAAAICRGESPRPIPTAVELVGNIFESCVKFGSFNCVKPKLLKFLSESLDNDRIVLTEDMSVVNNGKFSDWQKVDSVEVPDGNMTKKERLKFLMLEKIDRFLNAHELKVKLPKEIVTGEVFPFVPKYLLGSVPEEIVVPLSGTKNVAEERGFMKKVIVPFLLGLKIKATTFVPISIALIALKTWKALTLGLLSLVLSAAMVIFKFAKPKVVNYEVYHYPPHHVGPPPIIEHSYMEHHGYGRSDGQQLAYSAHRK